MSKIDYDSKPCSTDIDEDDDYEHERPTGERLVAVARKNASLVTILEVSSTT